VRERELEGAYEAALQELQGEFQEAFGAYRCQVEADLREEVQFARQAALEPGRAHHA